ncbi:MAG: hypothetical protein Q8L80_12805 [Gallionella sp.]|nr:hypothetical protein [Gallionella sp.]MDP1941399.1 hypothetical protein [Gallionella sp.]
MKHAMERQETTLRFSDGALCAQSDDLICRTAVYGPVCTVVWEGEAVRLSPIPISHQKVLGGDMDWKEIREWIQLTFVIVGGTIALIAFFQNLRQRKLENSLKLVALFRESLRPTDIVHWIELFRSSSELSGSPRGKYAIGKGDYRSIGDYFSEGSGDENAISRMAQNLEIICHELSIGTADVRIVYYELGQLLTTMHEWLGGIEAGPPGHYLLDQSFPSIERICKKHKKEFAKWPSRVYAYIE